MDDAGTLVCLGSDARLHEKRWWRGSAVALMDSRFIAHLIGMRDNVGQHRLKNKTAPETGAVAYVVSWDLSTQAVRGTGRDRFNRTI